MELSERHPRLATRRRRVTAPILCARLDEHGLVTVAPGEEVYGPLAVDHERALISHNGFLYTCHVDELIEFTEVSRPAMILVPKRVA